MPGVKATMDEFKKGTLHSGSKTGPVVTNPKQAVAIALSEKRKGKKKRRKTAKEADKEAGESLKKDLASRFKKY